MKLTPMNCFDPPIDGADFGRSLKFVLGDNDTDNLLVIGLPGFFHDSGKVYIFSVAQGS
jgi:hypothetical protein